MYQKSHVIFRTYQHRLYPTAVQKNELDVRFAIEDDFSIN